MKLFYSNPASELPVLGETQHPLRSSSRYPTRVTRVAVKPTETRAVAGAQADSPAQPFAGRGEPRPGREQGATEQELTTTASCVGRVWLL